MSSFWPFSTPKHPSPQAQITSGFRHGLVRFNPFLDTGGDQSFALSLLDGQGNGILITSLHSRDSTRLYVKEVQEGRVDQEISQEERQAIKKALEK